MRPLQENSAIRNPTMQLHDSLNSYKCFDAIATPSPIPIDFSLNSIANTLRSTSLDSLANTSDQDSASDDRSSDIGLLSECDSINNCEQSDAKTDTCNDIHRKSDLDENHLKQLAAKSKKSAPIVDEYLEKLHRKCDFKDCKYKKLDQSVCECVTSDCAAIGTETTVSTNTAALIGQTLSQQQQQKTRRTSIASCGSIGRMETIIEEPPIEPKISVKEILARFETLTSLEVIENSYSHC